MIAIFKLMLPDSLDWALLAWLLHRPVATNARLVHIELPQANSYCLQMQIITGIITIMTLLNLGCRVRPSCWALQASLGW